MKTCIKKLFLLPLLIPGLGILPADQATAQTFTALHNFSALTGSSPGTNSDGSYPAGRLVSSGDTLHGVTSQGGASGAGTLFKIKIDGTAFTNIHIFASFTGPYDNPINTEGVLPNGLVLAGNTLYGTAVIGGDAAWGTVFKVNGDGSDFTTLHSFTEGPSDGAYPRAAVESGGVLYGVAGIGGEWGSGTVFKINTNGTGFTNLHSFADWVAGGSLATNSDGISPQGLIVASNKLYGITYGGGRFGYGTVFKVNTDGTGFTNLHVFTATAHIPNFQTNTDGASPLALVLSGNSLYGTAFEGGASGSGTVFKLNTDGSGFTTLHSFSASDPITSTNSDGIEPQGLILSGETLYGVAQQGGSSTSGTIFELKTNGSGFRVLHDFATREPFYPYSNSDGANPQTLHLLGGTLYGTAVQGGDWGTGTVFSLSLTPPQLTIGRSGANVVLTWPADATGFTLQSAPTITGTFTNVSGATTPYTNAATSSQMFFRVSAN